MEHDTETEGSREQDRHEEEGENDEAVGTLGGEKEKTQHGDPGPLSSSLAAGPELRLVLLGRTGSGKSTAGNCILGREVFSIKASEGAAGKCECESRTAKVAGRKLTVVDTPDWFCTELSPEDVQHQIVSCQALVAPGPHAFLLCVPVDRPASVELQGLQALEMVFGPGAVGRHTLVLFTHADRLPAGVTLEEYVSDRERQDLLKLVESCGDHYHTLERGRVGEGGGGEGEQEKRSVEELLEKVEQVVLESGADFHAWPAKDEPETRSKGLRRDREEEQGTARRPDSLSLSSPIQPPERGQEIQEEPTPPSPPESESTEAHEDDVTEGDEDRALEPTPAGPPPSFLRGLWDTLTGWICSVPRLVRGSALLGALVGFFVGGPVGSMLGVTVGSVATEVGRRKRVKKTQ